MTRRFQGWIGGLVAFLLIAGTLALIHWQTPRPVTIRGAVLVQNADPHKQQPIGGVVISAGDLALSDTKSDSSGLFVLTLHTLIRRGHPIVLSFRDPQYHPLDLKDFVSNKLYIVHLVPVAAAPAAKNQPDVKVTNVRVRYTVKAMTELNVGSAAKTFEIKNNGNIPCNGQRPCSPDGRWKANAGSASIDAGPGNVFRDARASCIAGPCPFTKVDGDHVSPDGQIINVSALDWSDTATFLLEAEVFHPMLSQVEHWSYPVIFGEGLSFTLPAAAGSVSIEADIGGTTIIFPLGPSIFLSWATCDVATNRDTGRVYLCTPKPGYTFQ
jgi:hypothetical protein